MKLRTALTVIFIRTTCHGQIINIESKRMRTDSSGWAGEASVTFDLVKYSDYIVNLGVSSHLQYKHKKFIAHLLSDYVLVKSAGEDIINTGYGHLRYGHKLTPNLTWEVFTQAQFNEVLDIGLRSLVGSGPRFKFYDTDNFRIYAATAYMYEYQENAAKTVFYRDHRSSSYLTFTIEFERFTFVHTTYYQPLFKNIRDYLVASQNKLNIELFKGLSFTTEFNYRYDSNPEPDIPKSTYVLTNGIALEF